jgi:hypothetical protein
MAFKLRRSVHALSYPLHIGCRMAVSHTGQPTWFGREHVMTQAKVATFHPLDPPTADEFRQRAARHASRTAPYSPHDHDPLRPRFENALAFKRIRESKRPTDGAVGMDTRVADRMLAP